MELQKLVERAQRLNSYVVAIVKSRNPEEFFVLALTDTYEDAVMCRRVLNADGIYDVIIVPPLRERKYRRMRQRITFGVSITCRYRSQQ